MCVKTECVRKWCRNPKNCDFQNHWQHNANKRVFFIAIVATEMTKIKSINLVW